MSTPGSRVMTMGLIVTLLSVSAGMHFGGFGLLLCFVGVVIGANLVLAGVGMADGPAPNPIVPMVFSGERSLAAFVCRNTAAVGLVMASCPFTVVSGEEDPVLCFGMFALLLLGVILINLGARGGYAYGATPPAMRTPGSRAMAIGFTIALLSASAGIHFGASGFGLLLAFTGVLTGGILGAISISMADHPAPTVPVVLDGACALAVFVRRNTATVGLVVASCAVTVVSGEAEPVLCFAMFALVLLGLDLINAGVRGE